MRLLCSVPPRRCAGCHIGALLTTTRVSLLADLTSFEQFRSLDGPLGTMVRKLIVKSVKSCTFALDRDNLDVCRPHKDNRMREIIEIPEESHARKILCPPVIVCFVA